MDKLILDILMLRRLKYDAPHNHIRQNNKKGGTMDKIILGILMLRRLTSYELRNIIQKNYKAMCSDSLGTIQATLKKLHAKGFVTCKEFVEKGVNKKVYSITDAGRDAFMEWLKTPADLTKGKNMEIGKLLLMGFVPSEERISLINECISILSSELSYLEEIQSGLQSAQGRTQCISILEQDAEYASGIQNATNNSNIAQNADEISLFQALTLQFGIDGAKFQIEWFSNLRSKIDLRAL